MWTLIYRESCGIHITTNAKGRKEIDASPPAWQTRLNRSEGREATEGGSGGGIGCWTELADLLFIAGLIEMYEFCGMGWLDWTVDHRIGNKLWTVKQPLAT